MTGADLCLPWHCPLPSPLSSLSSRALAFEVGPWSFYGAETSTLRRVQSKNPSAGFDPTCSQSSNAETSVPPRPPAALAFPGARSHAPALTGLSSPLHLPPPLNVPSETKTASSPFAAAPEAPSAARCRPQRSPSVPLARACVRGRGAGEGARPRGSGVRSLPPVSAGAACPPQPPAVPRVASRLLLRGAAGRGPGAGGSRAARASPGPALPGREPRPAEGGDGDCARGGGRAAGSGARVGNARGVGRTRG